MSIPATIPKFPVDPITVEQLRALPHHRSRDCTYDYVVRNAQFYLGPVNLLMPCVLVGMVTYWRDSASGGREQVNAYHFRVAGMTSRLDGLGEVEKVYMNDAAEDALLQIAYVARKPSVPVETVKGWIAIEKATRSVTSLRDDDDPAKGFFLSNPDDYVVLDVTFDAPSQQ